MTCAYIKSEDLWIRTLDEQQILDADPRSIVFIDEDDPQADSLKGILGEIQSREPVSHPLLQNLMPETKRSWGFQESEDTELPDRVRVVDEYYANNSVKELAEVAIAMNGKPVFYNTSHFFRRDLNLLEKQGIVAEFRKSSHEPPYRQCAIYAPDIADENRKQQQREEKKEAARQKNNIPADLMDRLAVVTDHATYSLRLAGLTSVDLHIGLSFRDRFISMAQSVRMLNGLCGENLHRKMPSWRKLMVSWEKHSDQAVRWLKRNGHWKGELIHLCSWLNAEQKVRKGRQCNAKPVLKIPKLYRGQK